ncbi:MAG: Hachiman antiphage defense system protein HamA, partial [Candidatus Eremiobacterota bacterium]
YLKVRLDKMGKIGEYIFCNLLSEYFGFDCIIPKVHLTTDPNMNVYGIDTLFYSYENDMILFGEAKLSKSLANGTGLINKSLKTYEQQIRDEYTLMLSNRFLRNNMGIFGDKYAGVVELCLSIEDFIEKADVKKIGIPIFISHGTDTTPNDIFIELNKIRKESMFGIATIYIAISLPIFDKNKMIAVFTQGIAERRAYYEQEAVK